MSTNEPAMGVGQITFGLDTMPYDKAKWRDEVGQPIVEVRNNSIIAEELIESLKDISTQYANDIREFFTNYRNIR